MATNPMTRVIQHFRKATRLREGAGLTDGQLLHCFVAQREETAFEALVRRHGPMVWGVCRRVLRNHQDAEDAFQATFLVLVCKAASIASRELLANWLYGVAYHTALKARAAAARRRARERPVTQMPELEAAPPDLRHDLQPLLDQELSRLPDKYRVPIVLCDLDGKTRKEAARQLGWPEGTVAGRLARGRTMLAKRLTRQGMALSGGSLAAALSQSTASAGVPASLVSATVQAASLWAAGQAAVAGGISAQVAALTEGVVKAMFLTKLKIATALVLGLGVLAAATSDIAYRVFAGSAGRPNAAARIPLPAEATEQPKTDLEKLQGSWVLVAGELDGQKAPEGYVNHFRAVFTDNKLVFRTKDNQPIPRFSRDWTVQLDPKTKPKAMDLRSGDQHAPCIYEMDGETLQLCGGDTGGKRPTEFKGGAGLLFLILKREPAVKGDEKADKDETKIQGSWQVVSREKEGKETLDKTQKHQWVITRDKITMKTGDKGREGAYKLDPTQEPKGIDLTPREGPDKGETFQGIYRLEGDNLKICLSGPGMPRPKEFATKEDDMTLLLVLKREPAAKGGR